jgi:hypothetical protein
MLPDSLLVVIFTIVTSNRRLHACSLVCRSWKQVLSSAVFWKKMAFKQQQIRHELPSHLLITLCVDEYKHPWLVPIFPHELIDSGKTMVLQLSKPTYWEELCDLLEEKCGVHEADYSSLINLFFLDQNENLFDIICDVSEYELEYDDGWFIFTCDCKCLQRDFRIMFACTRHLEGHFDYIECRIDDEFERDDEHYKADWARVCWKQLQFFPLSILTSDSLKVRTPH